MCQKICETTEFYLSSFTSSGKIQNAILSIVLVRVGGVEWGVQAGDNWVFTTIRIITDKPSPGQVSITRHNLHIVLKSSLEGGVQSRKKIYEAFLMFFSSVSSCEWSNSSRNCLWMSCLLLCIPGLSHSSHYHRCH